MKQLIALVLFVVLAPAAFSQGMVKKKAVESAATPAATTAPTKGPAPAAKATKSKGWTGTVCTLAGCASGKCNTLTAGDAQKAAGHNEILVLCVGKKGYVVINADGTNASSKLAEKAAGKVTVTGKMATKSGLAVIIADSIN